MTLEDRVETEPKVRNLESIASTPDKLEEKPLSVGRKLYHAVTTAPALAISYASAGVGGALFTSFLTLGGMVKRKKQGQRFSGEKTFKDLKAGGYFSPIVNGLYSFVNQFDNPIVKTLALNPVSYAVFNGAYLGYTYLRDKVGRKLISGYEGFKEGIRGMRSELKKEWGKLNKKMLGFLPLNYANVNMIKDQWAQVGLGSLIDFAYGLITTKKKKSYRAAHA